MGTFNKFFTAIFILIPFFVLSQKEYFPTNSGVKVVNEPYKAFVNATIVVNSEKTIKNGTLIFRDGKIIDVGSGIKIPKNSIVIDKKMHIRGIYNGTLQLEMRQIIDDIKTLKRLN